METFVHSLPAPSTKNNLLLLHATLLDVRIPELHNNTTIAFSIVKLEFRYNNNKPVKVQRRLVHYRSSSAALLCDTTDSVEMAPVRAMAAPVQAMGSSFSV